MNVEINYFIELILKIKGLFSMNAVFELEVNNSLKLVKDFACLTSVGKLFHRRAPL